MVLHASVGNAKSSLDWLTAAASRVSSHYFITKTGVIYQLVSETEAAWHAGDASWQGETAVNEISIGVELENDNDGKDPYPAAQVAALTELARGLKQRYPGIAFARHLDVALPKGRKTDPAGFGWVAWNAQLSAPQTPTPPPVPALDPFERWGAIGHPTGAAMQFAVPKAWLINKALGPCVVPETYSESGKFSVTEFQSGIITYFVVRNTTDVDMF